VLWLFGQIWIWLILAFAAGAVLTAFFTTWAHERETRNQKARERDLGVAAQEEPDQEEIAQDIDPYERNEDQYDFLPHSPAREPAEVSTEQTTILNEPYGEDQWPTEEPDTPPSAHRGTTTRYLSNTGGLLKRNEPEWPRDEDWPDRSR
jgi:hypothetical protein